MTRLCSRLVREDDAEIVFLSTCQGVPEYWTDDSEVAAGIAARLDDDVRAAVTVDADHHDPVALRELFTGVDVVVATRLHAAIVALTAGTPAIAIAYEPKTREVFDRLGMSELVVDIDHVIGDDLVALVRAVLAATDEQRDRWRHAVERERDDAECVASLLAAVRAH